MVRILLSKFFKQYTQIYILTRLKRHIPPEKSHMSPEKSHIAPQRSYAFPQKSYVFPQKCHISLQTTKGGKSVVEFCDTIWWSVAHCRNRKRGNFVQVKTAFYVSSHLSASDQRQATCLGTLNLLTASYAGNLVTRKQ